jgi:hypothetical protein
MHDFGDFDLRKRPFRHFVGEQFVDPETVREINATWPSPDARGWWHELGSFSRKSALMFPNRLHEPAQRLAEALYSPPACNAISEMLGFRALPDPWFTDGPLVPRLGGGLHEIHLGGMLKMHVDFDRHPSGLQRAANLLIYLTPGWQDEWGGALELGADGDRAVIQPRGGTAVLFESNGQSWHGHPTPLACPDGVTRRSLALYYYRVPEREPERETTRYRGKR